MNLRILISLLLLSLGSSLSAQGIKFRKLDNLNIPDGSLNMIATQEGNFVSVGYWEDDGWLIKINPCGGIIWSKQFQHGLGRTLGFDVVERPDGKLVMVQQIDTLLPFLNTSYRIPGAWLVETNACGDMQRERLVKIPAGNTFGVEVLCPAAAYAIDNTSQDGLVVAGQTVYWEITDTVNLTGSTRKTLFLSHFDYDFAQIGYTVFEQFPLEDTLVGYDVLSLPNEEGFVVSGAYFDASEDSVYLLAIKTDVSLATEWVSKWAAAPPQFLPTVGGSNLSTYHAAVSLAMSPSGRLYVGGSQYLDTVLGGVPVQTIGAGVYELELATGQLLRSRVFPDLQHPLSIGLGLTTFEEGVMLAGSVLQLGNSAPASAVYAADWELQTASLYSYTDGGAYHYLATSVLSYEDQPGGVHALSGVRYLPSAPDSTSSILFFNSGAINNLPVTPTYYGGPIVQIEEVNVLDTAFCAPTAAPTACTPFVLGLAERLEIPAFEIFPVPAAEKITVQFTEVLSSALIIKLQDLAGNVIQSWQLRPGTQETTIDLPDLPSGLYLLNIGTLGVRKVMVKN